MERCQKYGVDHIHDCAIAKTSQLGLVECIDQPVGIYYVNEITGYKDSINCDAYLLG